MLRTKDNSAEVTLKGPDKKRYTTGWVQGESGAALINKLRAAAEADGKINALRHQAGALERDPARC